MVSRDMSGDVAISPIATEQPTTTEEVQALVRAGKPLAVISRGRNWGYAERALFHEGTTLVDLSRMNRIIEVNETLGYVVLQPGVSQGQLSAYLAQHHPRLWMDCSAAGPDASVVGNLLDRGFGHTPYGDRFEQCASLEVVLGTGELFRTGFSAYPGAIAAHAYGHGVGPVLKGLFTQSNYGIVTQAAMWLMPKPEHFEAFFLQLQDGELPRAIDTIAKLQLSGALRSKVHIANDLRTASTRGPRNSFASTERSALRKQIGSGAWNISGGLYGSRAQVKASKKELWRNKMRPFFVSERSKGLITFLANLLGKAGSWHGALAALDLLQGRPTAEALTATQWACAEPDLEQAKKDPSATKAGIVWMAPVFPAQGSDVAVGVALTERIMKEHGIDPLITLTFITPRSVCAVTQIAFDVSSEEQRSSARKCHDALLEAYLERGIVPYRCHPWGHAALRKRAPEYWRVAAELKRVFDPASIINEGRYVT